jgi:shikimate dehydrogenase
MKPVYSMDDLSSRDRLEEGCAKPAKLAVIGQPIHHSRSPQMHQAALDQAGIEARYIRLEVAPGMVRPALDRMIGLGFVGCNVTVPHKLEAMTCCDQVDDEARLLGAVNTLRFDDGRIIGYNTDGPGFAAAVEQAFGLPLEGMRVAIVGAGGGAGRALAVFCALRGVASLLLANRSTDKLAEIRRTLESIAPGLAVTCCGTGTAEFQEGLRTVDLLVNATSLGMEDGDDLPVPAGWIPKGAMIYDAIYQPAETKLLGEAARRGCAVSNGLGMLLHQGAEAFRIWFPGSEPLAAMRAGLAQG